MASQLFEAPSHEAHYSSPEAHYSTPEAHYSTPEAHEFEAHFSSPEGYSSPEAHEFEGGFEAHEAHYSSPEAHEFEAHEYYGSPEAHEFEYEFETPEAHEAAGYSNPEYEWEAHEASGYSNPEFEYEYESELEGEYFFGGLKRLAKRIGSVVAPLAKRVAPGLARTLVGMIPGVGGLLAPVAGQLVGKLVSEAEGEAQAQEAEFFGPASAEGEFELSTSESAHEAALAEVMAAQAAEATTEAEAESMIAASLPIVITISGGRRALRRVMPVLAKANRALVRTLRTKAGPDGRQLVRLAPQIQRRTAIALRNAQRRGVKVTGPLALRVMSTVARRVLANTPAVASAVARNIQIRQKLAPAHRHPAGVARCPGCVGRSRVAAVARTAVRPAPRVPAGARPRHRV